MAEVTLYTFNHKEVATALIKQQGIHEGRWTLAMTFSISVSNIGSQDPNTQLKPGLVAVVDAIGLQRAQLGENNHSLTVDAAEVNPA
ncbi:hypothetical protein MQC88_08245 [Luteimonas sp. 50]|uniref:Uncharacterized protein n=1 Tax=Cognatiluteimonas sedimenti TaxID=2927791 RepID=A0ABT0A4P1_9GAMM|nr:hypothetical protein [Lysobacter sedimenti]MCJ0825944.1 hypothetical protein [Lysobacter sedimenti]